MNIESMNDQDAIKFALHPTNEVRVAFESLAKVYAHAWGLMLVLTDTQGAIIADEAPYCGCRNDGECAAARMQAMHEALRWGEPSMTLCPSGFVIWAVPVMQNSVVTGAIVAEKAVVASSDDPLSPQELRRAVSSLLSMAEEANITNGALMELRREAAKRESQRAEAIHEVKGHDYQSIRDLYLLEEPALISAIKRGDRPAAREIINRVLVGIYYFGNKRPSLLKSFILELIVTMSRSAVEAGGDPTELLGANYSSFADLARIETEEELCAWLVSMLERIMDAIKSNREYHSSVLLSAAFHYMEDHLHEEITRDDVANVACLSPSHFSRVVKQTFGHSYTDLLARMRVDKSRELLVRSDKSLIQICLDCGFSDPSYYTKVFRKYTGHTPSEYRRTRRSS